MLKRRWVVVTGYVSLAFLSFVFFLFQGFPFERLVRAQLANVEREAGLKIDFASLKSGWTLNLVGTDVRVRSAVPRGVATVEPSEPIARFDKLSVSPRILPLLRGKAGVRIDGLAYGGRIKGTIGGNKKTADVDLVVSNVELAKYGLLANKYQINAAGVVSGTIDLTIDQEDAAKSKGKINLAVKNARLDESNPYNLQKIPATTFDKGGAVVIDVKDGKVTFTDVGLHGDDLDVSLEGDLQLRKRLNISQWSARTAIKVSDSFKSAVPLLDAFLGPGKGGDGVYRYKLSGILGRPRPSPDKSGAR